MVDFGIHIFCGKLARKRKLFGIKYNHYKKSFNGISSARLVALENLYGFSFNLKTVFLKMLIETFLD